MKSLGQTLKKKREEGKITQREMADACGLSQNYISAIERGINKCNAQTLISYADKLNLSLDDLIGRKRDNMLPELKRTILSLNEENQKKLLEIVKVLYQNTP